MTDESAFNAIIYLLTPVGVSGRNQRFVPQTASLDTPFLLIFSGSLQKLREIDLSTEEILM